VKGGGPKGRIGGKKKIRVEHHIRVLKGKSKETKARFLGKGGGAKLKKRPCIPAGRTDIRGRKLSTHMENDQKENVEGVVRIETDSQRNRPLSNQKRSVHKEKKPTKIDVAQEENRENTEERGRK